MKKLLYSSAAVIASCGLAAAEVSVGGAAKFGVHYTEDAEDNLSIAHDVDLTLTLSGQTDAGLAFGATATFTNQQGVDITVTSTTATVATETFTDTDTNSHTGMYYDSSGAAVYLGADEMPVYSVSASTGTNVTTYISNAPGSTFTTIDAGTGVTVTGVKRIANGTLAFADSTETDGINTRTIGDNAKILTAGAGYFAVEVSSNTFNIYKMDSASNSGWIQVNRDAHDASEIFSGEAPARNTAAAALVKAATDGTGDTPAEKSLGAALTALHRALSAADAGMAVAQTTSPSAAQDFSDTISTESATGTLANDAKVYISGGFGKISVGSVDAGDLMASGIADVGYGDGIGVDGVAEALRGKSGKDFLYEFSAGGVSFGVSAAAGGDDAAVGIKYALDPISVGLGYATMAGGDNVVSVGIGASLAAVSTNVMYSRQSNGDTAAGMDASFAAADNMTVTVAGASNDIGGVKTSAYGLGLSFDLGGGATLGTGIGTVDDVTKADLGMKFTF